jgi:hypothetical protein
VNTACGFGCQVFANSQPPQFRKPLLATLPTPPVYTSQTTAYPTVKNLQYRSALAVAKIAPPAKQVTIESRNHLLDCYTSSVAGQFPDSSLESAQTARRNAPLRLFADYYTKTQKLTPPGSVNFALGLINLELELAGNELTNAFHNSLACSLAAHIDVAVVNKTVKAGSSGSRFAIGTSVPLSAAIGASPLPSAIKASSIWIFRRFAPMSCVS